jgi:O-antigen/teichoic acid export membrane protein
MSENTTTGLGQKVYNSSIWMIGGQWLNRIIGFASVLILARLLTPEDYGICAMATLIISFLEIVTVLGGDRYLIKTPEVDKHDYNTAWTIRLIQFTCISLLLYLAAPQIAKYMQEPRLTDVLHVLALSSFISGFENIWLVKLRKELDFSRIFWFRFGSKLSGFFVTVTLAILFKNYWAIVFGTLTMRTSAVILSYLIKPALPQLTLSRFRDQWGFSQWVLLSNFAVYLRNKVDQLIVSKFFGPSGIGLYNMGAEIANLPTTDISIPLSQAIFPGISKLITTPKKFALACLQVLGALTSILLPIGIGMAYASANIVHVVLGPQWVDAINIVCIIAIFGIAFALYIAASDILTALGHIKTLSLMSWAIVSALVPALVYSATHGANLNDIAMIRTALAWAILPVYYYLVVKHTEITVKNLLSCLLRPALATLAMVGALVLLDSNIKLPLYFHLITQILLGAMTYLTMLVLLWRLAGRPASGEKVLLDNVLRKLNRSST